MLYVRPDIPSKLLFTGAVINRRFLCRDKPSEK